MAQPTLKVLDGDGAPKFINTTNPNGPALKADSQSVVLATDHPNVPVAVQGTVPISAAATLNVAVQGTVPISSGSALDVNVKSLGAGERNAASATASYLVTRAESNPVAINVTTPVAIGGANVPIHLAALVNVTGAVTQGTITITGINDQTGTPFSWVIPAGVAIRERISMDWARFDNGCTIQLSNAADRIVALYRPQ